MILQDCCMLGIKMDLDLDFWWRVALDLVALVCWGCRVVVELVARGGGLAVVGLDK